MARAEALAGAWGARARASTTIGQERAILRLFGVSGLDASGRPLAGAAVDRWLAGDPHGLGTGSPCRSRWPCSSTTSSRSSSRSTSRRARSTSRSRPSSCASPTGAPSPRSRPSAWPAPRSSGSTRSGRSGARRSTSLGEAPRPWLGRHAAEPDVDAALDEAANLIGAGIDLIRVEVPIGRELADRMIDAGLDVPTGSRATARPTGDRGATCPSPRRRAVSGR